MAMLCDIYGDDLKLLPPRVRYMSLGNRVYEPIMLLRVRTAPSHLDAVRNDLASRKLKILEEHEHPSVCVLRAEGPLRKLLGYGESLAKLTGDKALHWIWLDRYVPQDEPPGDRAA
jgi:translation elongation factor EF-G